MLSKQGVAFFEIKQHSPDRPHDRQSRWRNTERG
jgi:hypothetical protein